MAVVENERRKGESHGVGGKSIEKKLTRHALGGCKLRVTRK